MVQYALVECNYRGVIKPYGFSIWELMRSQLDKMFKETGHENAYFPLFVPKSLFEAEEKNAEGFAKECAVVTHYRLKNDPKIYCIVYTTVINNNLNWKTRGQRSRGSLTFCSSSIIRK